MDKSDRRAFLKLVGSPALAAALPLDLSRALAIPARYRTGTIDDVEHIIILMQENRSFDHYFGTLRGVRGFADPRAIALPSGNSVWQQPHDAGHLLPFRPDVKDLGRTFLPDPPHGWNDTHAAWNGGQYDQWVPNKGVTTMTYHTRQISTTAFDSRTPNTSRQIALPSTEAFKPADLVRHPDEMPVPPAQEALPGQEPGVRLARALSYALDALGAVQTADGSFWIQFRNTGRAGAVFHVRSGNSADAPRTYTVGPRKQLTDSWSIAAAEVSEYDLSVYGPNGFYRAFKGGVSGEHRANLQVRTTYDENRSGITLDIVNNAPQIARISVLNRYTARSTIVTLRPGESESKGWSLVRTSGWYDLAITVEGDVQFVNHLAGHLENGEDSISDPIMGGLV